MIATLALIPRPVLFLLALAVYGAIVRWRFSAPMAIDLALLALLIYRPSLGLAAWVACLMIVRHTPALSADVAALLRLDSFDGWTARLVVFTLPALRSLMVSGEDAAQNKDAVEAAATNATIALQSMATPNNEYSSGLSDSERRQFEVRALTIASLYEAGIVTNLSKAICRSYGCSVQSAAKTDSTYQMALKAVNRHLTKKEPQFRQEDGNTAPAHHPVTKGQTR